VDSTHINALTNPLNIETAAASVKSAAGSGTLNLMFVFACIMVPIVLIYTIIAYRVFRKRLSVENLPPEPTAAPAPAVAGA
jgi:cytochrome d ubiquinol oxidase subunit II